jgi:hypothetical protein
MEIRGIAATKKNPEQAYAPGVVRKSVASLRLLCWAAGCRGRGCRPARPNELDLTTRQADSMPDCAR